MELKINQIDFEVATSVLQDELISQLEVLALTQMQFVRKFQGRVHHPQSHTELVFDIRNIISNIQQTYKDVEGYFRDLHMQLLFQFFRKMQVLMVSGYNLLSQALLTQIDINQQNRRLIGNNQNPAIVQIKKSYAQLSNKQRARQMQQYDYKIRFHERQEERIAGQMHQIMENLMLSKGYIEKLAPSKAVRELQEMKERAEINLQCSQKLFEQAYQLKYMEFKQHLGAIQKPEDLTKQFTLNIKGSIKQKFAQGVKKTASILQQMHKKQQLKKRKQQDTQTFVLEEKKQKTQKKMRGDRANLSYFKDKKVQQKHQNQIDLIKKQMNAIAVQCQSWKHKFNSLDLLHRDISHSYSSLQIIYQQKRQQIAKLNNQLQEFRSKMHKNHYKFSHFQSVDQQIQTTVIFFQDIQSQTPQCWKGTAIKSKRIQDRMLQNQIENSQEMNDLRRSNGKKRILKQFFNPVSATKAQQANSILYSQIKQQSNRQQLLIESQIQEQTSHKLPTLIQIPSQKNVCLVSQNVLKVDNTHTQPRKIAKKSIQYCSSSNKFNMIVQTEQQATQTQQYQQKKEQRKSHRPQKVQKESFIQTLNIKQQQQQDQNIIIKKRRMKGKPQKTLDIYISQNLKKRDQMKERQIGRHMTSESKLTSFINLKRISGNFGNQSNSQSPPEYLQHKASQQKNHFQTLNINSEERQVHQAKYRLSKIVKSSKHKLRQLENKNMSCCERQQTRRTQTKENKRSMLFVDQISQHKEQVSQPLLCGSKKSIRNAQKGLKNSLVQ